MTDPDQIKQQLHQACVDDVERRIATVRNILDGIAGSRANETKSSVGDKYETGRAMLQREEAQARQQLAQALEQQRELTAIRRLPASDRVARGSLVVTDRGSYYLAKGLGKVTVAGAVYYCVSLQSPVGQALLGRGVGEEVLFGGLYASPKVQPSKSRTNPKLVHPSKVVLPCGKASLPPPRGLRSRPGTTPGPA
ncbi:3-oxoacyl-ACP synthase [Lewinella sp. IMCC34183]|uniref:3-oxoacyl-ACP synthase n=1 Tax=Lewinella sp. IMCC34183 TaxID=2248762 RepID=UPI000E27ECCE|nr:3-oxoacyl-ACP synthase [Lewinella sp. IMCC34183]